MKYLIITLIAAAFLAACSTLSNSATSARLIVQYATLKVIDGDTDRAARLIDITEQVQNALSDDGGGSVSVVMGIIDNHVPWSDLDPADVLLARTLLDELEAELTARYGERTNVLPAALTVAKWVQEAARL